MWQLRLQPSLVCTPLHTALMEHCGTLIPQQFEVLSMLDPLHQTDTETGKVEVGVGWDLMLPVHRLFMELQILSVLSPNKLC